MTSPTLQTRSTILSPSRDGEDQYLELLERILRFGSDRNDRTGTGTRGLFGAQMRFNLADEFPLITTKKVHFKSIVTELLWFLRGDTNVQWLQENGCKIWDEWADENGELGPVYGKQWRSWPGVYEGSFLPDDIDQIAKLIEGLKTNPNSRRHIVSAWNPAQVDDMALPPCHCLFQFYVADGKLSCQLYQRSADMFLGVPFNIASYSLLTMMVAQVVGLDLGEFIHTFGDVHLYHNHFEQAELQLNRIAFEPPAVAITPRNSIFDYQISDFVLHNYEAHPAIKAPVAV